jgi:hypothetical protein
LLLRQCHSLRHYHHPLLLVLLLSRPHLQAHHVLLPHKLLHQLVTMCLLNRRLLQVT